MKTKILFIGFMYELFYSKRFSNKDGMFENIKYYGTPTIQ
tara:strand:- start:3708 stop:3827 length:120 start_codon:yes stop_codon:yes gene_type:complete